MTGSLEEQTGPSMKVLLVEDDEGLCRLMERKLREEGITVECAHSGSEANTLAEGRAFDLLVMDHRLPDMESGEIVRRLQESGFRIPFMIITGQGDEKIAVELMQLGARDYVIKDAAFFDRFPGRVKRVLREIKKDKKLAEREEELRRAKEKLSAREAQLRLIFNNLTCGIALADTSGRFLKANPRFAEMLGYEMDEISGLTSSKITYKEDIPETSALIQSLIRGQKRAGNLEKRYLRKDGGIFWGKLSLGAIKDSKNETTALIGIFDDITERKRAEEKIRASEERFRNFFEQSGVHFWENDYSKVKRYLDELRESGITDLGRHFREHPETVQRCVNLVRVINMSRAAVEFNKAPDKETLLQGLDQIFSEDSRRMFGEQLVAFHSGKTDFECEFVSRTFTGEALWTDLTVRIAQGFENTWGKVYVSGIDITDLRKAAQTLRESEARYRSLFDETPISIWEEDFSGVKEYLEGLVDSGVTDFRNHFENHPEAVDDCRRRVRIIDVNKAAVKVYEAKDKRELLEGLDAIFTEEGKDIFRDELLALAEGKTLIEGEMEGRSFKGKPLSFLYRLSIPRDYEDTWSKVFVSDMEISNMKELEKELREERSHLEQKISERTGELEKSIEDLHRANLQLETVNRHKTQFLGTMSHELRTPLNSILGFSDLLKGQFFGILNAKQLGYLSQIEGSGKHLLSLINDLLDLSKIDAGEMKIEAEEFILEECIDAVINMMSTQFRKKHLKIETQFDSGFGLIRTDRSKLNQILLNLLSNAVKYTPEKGRVAVKASREAKFGIRIEVADTGMGIETEDLNKIFDEFYQAERTRSSQIEGTGIGLALTRRLVKLLGGEIGVESKPGKGSRFWFTLPQEMVARAKEEAREAEEITAVKPFPSRRRILVVEDNPANQAMILEVLSIHKHEVALASNGKEAIDLARSHNPELIFMDIRMPVMDGKEATRRLRKMPEFADIPIIALSASTAVDAEKEHLEAGCTEHLPKPVQTKEIFDVLRRYLGG